MDGDESITIALPDAVLDAIVERAATQVAARLQPAVEPWVGVDAVAAHLACRRQRVYDLVCRRHITGIPHRKEGARLLFKLSQIDRWIESGGAA
jgi:Helix-turn-helix domain